MQALHCHAHNIQFHNATDVVHATNQKASTPSMMELMEDVEGLIIRRAGSV